MAKRDLTGAVDFAHLETYTAGDAAIAEEVLGLFQNQVEVWLKLLDPAGPAESWRDAAHTLKGSALGVGAFELARLCSEAELASADSEGRKVAALDRIRDAAAAALADVAAYLHERALQSLRSPPRSRSQASNS